jgi:hypothetical protein
MQKIYLSLHPPPSPESEDMNLWITTRANVCGSAYNFTRTYISGQLKKSIYEYARANSGSFPFINKIHAIANRTIKLFLSDDEALSPMTKAEVRENINHFKWYWDVLLGRCCPSGTKFWESSTKYYTLISDKKSPITPPMEAFIIINFLNNYQYWCLRYNLELIHPNIAIQKKPKCTLYHHLKRVRPTKVGPWSPSSGRKVIKLKKVSTTIPMNGTLSTPNPTLGLVLVVAGQRRANFCLLIGWRGSEQHVTVLELVQWRNLSGGPFELII